MKLFKISQTVNQEYDSFDSAVVIARDEDDARTIHPSTLENPVLEKDDMWRSWCGIGEVRVEYLGEAKPGSERSIVCASFHAG